jgi:hypothetical protein
MRAAGRECLDDARVGVNADDLVSRVPEGDGERQANVAQPYDSKLHRR